MATTNRWLRYVMVLAASIVPGSVAAQDKSTPAPVPEAQATPAPTARTVLGFAIFKIDPRTPVQDLMPVPPVLQPVGGPLLSDQLDQVPEAFFEKLRERNSGDDHDRAAHMMAKIRHVNDKKTDGYISALLERRPDLAGLPFVLGDACRQQKEESHLFAQAVRKVRGCLNSNDFFAQSAASGIDGKLFWKRFASACQEEDEGPGAADKQEARNRARLAALMQILAIEPSSTRLGLVKYLATIAQVEAERALARLALFSSEEEVRGAAVTAMKGRHDKEAANILLAGFRYPMPAVAQRASQAVAKLQRPDLAPRLVDLLEQPDPRAPRTEVVEGKRNHVVREVVRVNHHRNCVMCHVPGKFTDITVAPTPLPSLPLSGGYGSSSFDALARLDLMIRIDVTYLRQDFSVLQPVANASPWPEKQRFDFLVRKRTLTEKEAASHREKLERSTAGKGSPYQQAIVAALRGLTGREASTPAEWRRLLELPRKSSS